MSITKIKIGSFSFDTPVFPAPMCGITDVPFRAMLSKFGTPVLYSEMLASHATILDYRNEYVKKTTLKEKNKIPFIIQIAGCTPDVMSEATKVAIDRGADIVDINFGCPVKKVVNSYAGSALMKDEKLSADIIKSVVKTATIVNKTPVTVKMRMGWDDAHLNAGNIVKIAESEGVQMTTIHCRTRKQMYSGKADWKFAKTIKEIAKIPILVNGDINLQNIDTAIDQSSANGVMIGRALYGKPWLIADCMSHLENSFAYDDKKNNDANYRENKNNDNAKYNSTINDTNNKSSFKTHKPEDLWNDCIKEHMLRIFDFYPRNNAIGFAIKNLYFYSQGIPNSADFRSKLSKCNEKNEILNIAESFF